MSTELTENLSWSNRQSWLPNIWPEWTKKSNRRYFDWTHPSPDKDCTLSLLVQTNVRSCRLVHYDTSTPCLSTYPTLYAVYISQVMQKYIYTDTHTYFLQEIIVLCVYVWTTRCHTCIYIYIYIPTRIMNERQYTVWLMRQYRNRHL